jgi:hypothetical protein
MRLALFLATCLAVAVLAPVAIAEDSPPSTAGVTAGAERSADEKPKKDNHGAKVRACAKQQKTDKRTAGGHGQRVRACAKKLREERAAKKKARQERVEQCRALQREMHTAMEELKAGFRERFEAAKELGRGEREAAMRALKEEFEKAMQALREEYKAKRAETCKGLNERAEENTGEEQARE